MALFLDLFKGRRPFLDALASLESMMSVGVSLTQNDRATDRKKFTVFFSKSCNTRNTSITHITRNVCNTPNTRIYE